MLPLLSRLFEPLNNGAEVTRLLLDILHVRISNVTLIKEITAHPDYPGLVSISDMLTRYGVSNIAANFPPDKFIQLPTPFITQLKGGQQGVDYLTVVTQITDSTCHFFDPERHKWSTSSLEVFMKKCTGLVLLTEAEDGAGEQKYEQKIREERIEWIRRYLLVMGLPVMVLLSGIMAFVQNGIGALLPFFLVVATLSGFITTCLLIWYELDQYNPLMQQFCSAGKKINCSAVLQSDAAKVAGVSWSAIGLTYFSGELLFLLFSGFIYPGALFILSWLNALALPYVVYSLYYQWKIVKQWCVLCLCVQGILLLQATFLACGGWYSLSSWNTVTPALLVTLVIAFVFPLMMVALLMPLLQKSKGSEKNKVELQRLKHNPQIFDALLLRQKAVLESTDGLGIILGNPHATHKIIKVCNPYCGPCAKAHTPMEELLHNNPDLQIQVIFTAMNNEKDKRMPPVKHLLAIAEAGDEAIIRQALDDWYLSPSKDYDVFASKYSVNGLLEKQGAKIEAMHQWCEKTQISFTPTFFVNGYQLPEIYHVGDLKYFLSV